MSIENILDATLDDLADAPSIQPFPNGAHKVSLEFKVDDKKSSVQMQMTYIEKLEIADPTSIPPAPGDKGFVFMAMKKKDGTPNEYGQGALKELIKVLKPAFAGATNKEILVNAKGATVAVVTKVRKGVGEYEGRDQMDIVSMSLL